MRSTANVKLMKLDNGSTIIFEKKSDTRTVSLAFAAKVGSAYEDSQLSGVSHFIEHALFKGTKKRSAYEIKEPIERVGGTLNAYTGRISTVFYAHVPDTHAKEALEILYDMVKNPAFSKEAVEIEKEVILEEIAATHDDPFDMIYDHTIRKIWDPNYGRSILGSLETVRKITPEALRKFHNRYYSAEHMVFAISGNFNQSIIERAEELLRSFSRNSSTPTHIEGYMKPKRLVSLETKKDLNQVHLLLSKPAPSRLSKDFVAFRIFNVLFGSGMSSVLFHNIREKLGMVYHIDSEYVAYHDFGTFFISASTNERHIQRLVDSVRFELERLAKEGVSENEYLYGKERLKGKIMLATESTLNSLSLYLDEVIINGKPKTVEEIISEINYLSLGKLNEVIERYLSGDWNISLLVPEDLQEIDPVKLSFSI